MRHRSGTCRACDKRVPLVEIRVPIAAALVMQHHKDRDGRRCLGVEMPPKEE